MCVDTRDLFCKTAQADPGLCSVCGAASHGLACWEVETSPCCQRSRTSCERCPVFIGYLRSTSTPARVLIGTGDGGILEGTVFLSPGTRVSDLLNHPDRAFIAVSRPRWRNPGPVGGVNTPVVILSLSSIAWVAPLGEEQAAPTTARVA